MQLGLEPAQDQLSARGLKMGRERRQRLGRRGVDRVGALHADDDRPRAFAIEALGRQETFENALRSIRPGGTLSSLGVYSGKLLAPYEAFYAGLGDQKIVTTLCPGGKERMRRLMAMVENRRVDLSALVTHHFALDDIGEAYDLFSHQRDGVLKVGLHPAGLAGTPFADARSVHATTHA